ncbi:serine/threonine protein kinase [Nocardia caishijiensis]|uniref:Serine/threonine protein kinase n=1 Tax=Nocardia caishijiensis TaxID=184756 RepID=A0ABQ6YIE8_9NOCA|nr:protein kinase [Nocardia caishijiensis]KAF0845284.1 serine/threonine protein kinase [Nocardia caishijiensis]
MAALTTIDPDDDAPRISYRHPDRHRGGQPPRTTLDNPAGATPSTTLDSETTATGATAIDHEERELPADLATRFTRVGFLGAGREASVTHCVDAGGRSVAIKLYWRPPTYTLAFDDPGYASNFDQANTVQVYERGVANSVHFEVMEYCASTLESLIVGRAGDQLATDVLRQLCAALTGFQGDASGERLVHSDLKPPNILVRSRSPMDLVLADFGLAAGLGTRSKLTNLGQGTIAYNAPELLRFKTPAADWWSLGMVMYHLIVGRSYFQRWDPQTEHLIWLDDYTIQSELLARDVSLVDLDDVADLGANTARWQQLLAGLLTRDTTHRWGGDEVRTWLNGGTPSIFRRIEDTPGAPNTPRPTRAATSFPIPGVGEFFDAGELGQAMAEHPGNAARALTGPGRKRLTTWLSTEANTGDRYIELTTHGENWGPDELVTYFISRLAPDLALTYRDASINTPADLRELAGRPEAAVRSALYQHELLSCLATSPARAGYKMIDSNWHDIVAAADEMAAQHAVPLDDAGRRQIVARGLLLAASDEPLIETYVDQVRRQLADPSAAAAGDVVWFAALRAGVR